MTAQEKLIIKIKQAETVSTLSIETIKDILNKYEVLASVELGETSQAIVESNTYTYSIILLPIVYRTLYNIVGSKAYNDFCSAVPHINKIMRDTSGRDKFFAKYGKLILGLGANMNEFEELSQEKISQALRVFGIEELTDEEDDFDIVDDEEEDLDLDDLVSTSEESDDTEEEKGDTQDELLKRLKETWGDKLESVISGIMATYKRLYESGYGLVSPCGVLTNIGAVRSTTDGRIIQSGNKAMDMELFNAITGVLKGSYDLYADNQKEPDIFEIERAGKPIIYVGMHLKFMFGHIRFCNGINKYLKEHKIENESTTKVIKWGDISGYIRESIESYFYTAYIKYGVTDQASANDLQIANKINSEMSRNLKNVIILAERKKGVNTRVRIASDSEIDVAGLIAEMKRQLNVGTATGIDVRQVGDYKDGVVDINVVYNEKRFSQDSLFAYQVLDILKEQGIRPRWDNVILGKKDNGTIMTYNFKDRQNAVYAIYASSGSGKGVMTLNLISSAIADLCKVIYIDGKPDMGEVLADIAWKNNVEAAVYNGVSGKGTEMLENRGTSIRQENPFMDAGNIPDGIFVTEVEKEKFMLITTYLRGIELLCDIAAYRASQGLPTDDWVTAFVDECEQAAVAEIDVSECLERAETKRKSEKDENGKKINQSTDEVIQFIRGYNEWKGIIKSKFKTCITSTFRYANITIMFIWQSTKFPEQYKNKSVIAGVIDASSGVITKIFGKGAAVNYGSKVFGTPTSLEKATWYDGRFTGRTGGYFAIGKDVTSNSMEVFRPFNIYSDANHKELMIENAKAAGLTEDDLKGVSLDNFGNVIPEVGFEGYITKMLQSYNVTIADQMRASYEYFNAFITGRGQFNNLNEYMFDCHSFKDTAGTGGVDSFQSGFNVSDDYDETDDFDIGDQSVEMTDEEYREAIAEEQDIDLEDYGTKNLIDNINQRRIDDYRKAVQRATSERYGYNPEIFEPEIESVNSTVGVSIENGKVIVNDSSAFSVIDVDVKDFVEESESDVSTVNRFKEKLMMSSYGMNYNFKKRWQFILDSISREFPRSSMVVRVHILSDMMMANQKIVNINSMLDDGYGIMLEDIVNFQALVKKFTGIKEIILDKESFSWLAKEFSNDKSGIYNIFKMTRALDRIVIMDNNTPLYEVTRDGKNRSQVEKEAERAEFRNQIDQMSAGYNSHVDRKGPVYARRIADTSFGFTKNNWKRVKNSFLGDSGKSHPVRGAMWLGLAAVTGAVGALFFSSSKIMKAFQK